MNIQLNNLMLLFAWEPCLELIDIVVIVLFVCVICVGVVGVG